MPSSRQSTEKIHPKPAFLKHFRNKVVLITGGSSGIGLATARLLAASGAQLWLVARRQEYLESAVQSLRSVQASADQRFGYTVADVADAEQVANAVTQVSQSLGLPDIVINSAGITHPGYVQELDLSIFRELMEVNYFGSVHVVKAVLPGMMARRSGHIVNISSGAGLVGVFGYSAYGATKYALRGFSDVLRAEMRFYNIRVSVVFPPDTDTPQLAYEDQFKPPETKAISSNASVLSPESVARTILQGILHKRYLIIPGFESKLVYLLGGALNPYLDYVAARARKKMART